jgi:CRP-like cAMP-binding protein
MPKGDKIAMKTLGKGKYFGEYEFFSMLKRTFSVRASGFCHIIKIPYDKIKILF